jgi:hypothetical protein
MSASVAGIGPAGWTTDVAAAAGVTAEVAVCGAVSLHTAKPLSPARIAKTSITTSRAKLFWGLMERWRTICFSFSMP